MATFVPVKTIQNIIYNVNFDNVAFIRPVDFDQTSFEIHFINPQVPKLPVSAQEMAALLPKLAHR